MQKNTNYIGIKKLLNHFVALELNVTLILFEYYSQTTYDHLPTVYLQRSNPVDLVEYLLS